jgi:exosortase/archaeosortase family protein
MRLQLRRRVLAFAAVYAVFYLLLSESWSEALSHIVIDRITVQPAAWLGRVLLGEADLVAAGSHLQSTQASLNVLYGCEGSDVLLLLWAAMLVAPLPWRARLGGLMAGAAFVFTANQARVLLLYWSFRWHRPWFGTLHGLVGPMLVVLAVTAFFLLWLNLAARDPDRAAPCAPSS